MHELSIIANLYEIMEEKAKEQGGKKITFVKLQVGILSGIVPDFLETAFEIFKKDTMASDAALEIEKVPLKIRCTDCGTENTSDELIEEARTKDIALLIIGDALSATTHTGLLLEAKEK